MKQLFSYFAFTLWTIATLAAQDSFYARLADSAYTLTKQKVIYDPSYFHITYPNGDVPSNKGVCTDVVIRAYRKLGIDLQKDVHEDMKSHFALYPKIWGLKSPNFHIDHRRVPNLMTFFSRFGQNLPISKKSNDYMPGDIVCWNLGNGLRHIGIISHHPTPDGKRFMVIHNIGAGQVQEDFLFAYPIIGHYRYNGRK